MATPANDPPPFPRLGIVGLGLIGGSVALASRAAWPGVVIDGVDRPEVLEAARDRGVIDHARSDAGALGSCDLIVLAAPVPVITALLASVPRGPIVTDVGSTKRQIMAAARDAGLASFVGGHPMAGSAAAGFEHARADLFSNRRWLLVEGAAGGTARERVEQFVRGLGADPLVLDDDAHDRIVAAVSHLPQILSVALMNSAVDAIGESGLEAAGPAFAEMTRLAASQADVWSGILASNADFVADAIARFTSALPSPAALRQSDWTKDAFGRAADARSRFGPPDKRGQ